MIATPDRFSLPSACGVLCVMLGTPLLLAGCTPVAKGPLVSATEVTSPSVLAVRQYDPEPDLVRRLHAVAYVSAEDGSVTHYPLYFEDPFEHRSWEQELAPIEYEPEDHLVWLYGDFRFLANAVVAPVSMVLNPPWNPMVSDGKPSRLVLGIEPQDPKRLR